MHDQARAWRVCLTRRAHRDPTAKQVRESRNQRNKASPQRAWPSPWPSKVGSGHLLTWKKQNGE